MVDLHAFESQALNSIADQLPHATRWCAATIPRMPSIHWRRCRSRSSRALCHRIPHPRTARLGVTLGAAWACVLGAIVAMAALLAGTKALGDRQAAFASAVTHELRTPITSLRLYADMLAEGMVADPAKRAAYLATIRAEAERLGRLVENVLAWARLERTRAGASITLATTTLEQLVSACQERLARRATEAGMSLSVDLGTDASTPVLANADMVEQVLFNLVDNACKYAASAQDRAIAVRAARRGDRGVR